MMNDPAVRSVRYSLRPCDECGTTARYLDRTLTHDDGRLWGHVCSRACARAVMLREDGATLVGASQGGYSVDTLRELLAR
jgi:alpha-D-ribose 1-methylphosphonate 5-phosphate C-P lyase